MLRRLLQWLKESGAHLRAHPAALAIVLLAAGAGAAAGVPVGDRFFSYQWADARFCDDCHAHDYANEGWERSLHAGLTTCHDCHLVPIRHYPKNLWRMIVDKPETQEDIHRPDIPVVVCDQCHREAGADKPLTGPLPDELRRRVVRVDDSRLHRLHLEAKTRDPGRYLGGDVEGSPHDGEGASGRAAEGHDASADEAGGHGGHGGGAQGPIGCMDCHGAEVNRAHRFESTVENCIACHPGQEFARGRLERLNCRECHFEDFLGASPQVAAP